MKTVKKINSSLLALLIMLIFAPGFLFGIARYKAATLPELLSSLQEPENFLSFSYKIFTKADCKNYLGRKKIIRKGYQPVQITLVNNTGHSFKFSLGAFSFPCVSIEEMAQIMDFSTTKRMVGWGVGSLFVSKTFLLPTAIEGTVSGKESAKLQKDFIKKGLSNTVVKPYDVLNGIIFVEKRFFNPHFSFTLRDVSNGKKYIFSPSKRFFELNSLV